MHRKTLLDGGRRLREGEALPGRRSEEYRELVQELVDAWERAEGLLGLNLLKRADQLQKAGNIGWRMSMEMLAPPLPGLEPDGPARGGCPATDSHLDWARDARGELFD